jgi:hypothetical protein
MAGTSVRERIQRIPAPVLDAGLVLAVAAATTVAISVSGSDHAEAVAEMALEMRDEVPRYSDPVVDGWPCASGSTPAPWSPA